MGNKKNKKVGRSRVDMSFLLRKRYNKTNDKVAPNNVENNHLLSGQAECHNMHIENNSEEPVSTSTPIITKISNISNVESSPSTSFSTHFTTNSISEHTLNIELADNQSTDTILSKTLEGRRLVDIAYFISQIQKRHGLFDCSFVDMEFQNETIKGFYSILHFKCKVCNIVENIYTENIKKVGSVTSNKAAVNACQAIGIGYTQLSEFLAFLELPQMSCSSFVKIQSSVAKIISVTAWEEMRKAGDEERELALKCGDIDKDGIPLCTVVADGQWSKRSYKTKYDALSGVATIIGFKTKKVLFIGVKNKYCVICQRSTTRKEIIPEHECFMNWKKASTSMEADGVVEGFLKSIEMHGLKFNRLIGSKNLLQNTINYVVTDEENICFFLGDGDSSVTKRLQEVQPYGPNFFIQKIECTNHLLRNYASKLSALTKNSKYPIRVRKFISTNIIRFRGDVTKAVKHWIDDDNLTKSQKIKEIQKDLGNGPFHRLGQHTNCAAYFCTSDKKNELNLIPEAVSGGIMIEIQNIISRLIAKADSLLENKDNNICEQFNSVLNKHIAGKRINFSGRGNYNTRVEAAVVAFNSKQFLRKIHKKMTNNYSPGQFGKKYLNNRERIFKNTAKRRQLFPDARKQKKKCSVSGPDEDYGLAEPLTDILTQDKLDEKKNEFLLSLDNANKVEIEFETREQNNSQVWYRERRIRLTASRFGQICKMRPSTSCKNTVYSILYACDTQAKSLQYGRDMEAVARTKAENDIGKPIQTCGLIIDPVHTYLAASPDGFIEDNAIVEIKCPFTAKNTVDAIDAVKNKLIPYCNIVEGSIKLKKEHIYYFQIMGQLHISRREICYFVIYTPNWMTIEKIEYDDLFWERKMIDNLKRFYLECLLPEIIDPLYPKRLLKNDIREPERIRQNIIAYKDKMNK